MNTPLLRAFQRHAFRGGNVRGAWRKLENGKAGDRPSGVHRRALADIVPLLAGKLRRVAMRATGGHSGLGRDLNLAASQRGNGSLACEREAGRYRACCKIAFLSGRSGSPQAPEMPDGLGSSGRRLGTQSIHRQYVVVDRHLLKLAEFADLCNAALQRKRGHAYWRRPGLAGGFPGLPWRGRTGLHGVFVAR